MDQPASMDQSKLRTGPLTETVLAALAEALRGVRYGTVTVVVQDGRVVQIDRTDRRRLKAEQE
ncbi:YezD family protein [Planctellipticum variicoloris]|uniref:YezD family protein n=1 Tax=Planctellipticum variicoloris TaxID=3064265 RepID=UPI003014057F|nr:YezD family protein [Planctomycetaceae bacterium SH412]